MRLRSRALVFALSSALLAPAGVAATPAAVEGPGAAGGAARRASTLHGDQSCASCHSAPSATSRPAWGGSASAPVYTMYGEGTPMASRVAGQPSPSSLGCLVCHDGTLGSDVHAAGPSLGLDLSNDHPISVVYDPAASAGALRPIDEVRTAGLRLERDGAVYRVECSTCHDPHGGEDGRESLRIDNRGSRLCLTCHVS